MKIIALDTETTDKNDDKSIVEFGMITTEYKDNTFQVVCDSNYAKRFKPRKPISFGATGVHHITEADVAECKDIGEEASILSMRLDHADFILGHNLKFDMEVIEREILGGSYDPEKQIDTLRLAKHAWDDLTEYNLAALRYRFDLPIYNSGNQHSAIFDAYLTLGLAILAAKVMEINNWPDLYDKSVSPLILKLMPFGKHRDEILEDIFKQDRRYFHWLWNQIWFEKEWPDLAYTLKVLEGTQTQE